MNKSRIWLFVVASLVLIVFIAGCAEVNENIKQEKLKTEINNKIEAANYCDVTSDCKIESFGCPFGCWNLVNKNANINEINSMVEEYNKVGEICIYDCLPQPKENEIKCVNNKCVAEEKIAECLADSDCGIGGCSGQVCTTKDKAKSTVTTCEFLKIYGCYKQTTCSCINSKCEWKETPEFLDCKAKASG